MHVVQLLLLLTTSRILPCNLIKCLCVFFSNSIANCNKRSSLNLIKDLVNQDRLWKSWNNFRSHFIFQIFAYRNYNNNNNNNNNSYNRSSRESKKRHCCNVRTIITTLISHVLITSNPWKNLLIFFLHQFYKLTLILFECAQLFFVCGIRLLTIFIAEWMEPRSVYYAHSSTKMMRHTVYLFFFWLPNNPNLWQHLTLVMQ